MALALLGSPGRRSLAHGGADQTQKQNGSAANAPPVGETSGMGRCCPPLLRACARLIEAAPVDSVDGFDEMAAEAREHLLLSLRHDSHDVRTAALVCACDA